jgi:hypothetical protein
MTLSQFIKKETKKLKESLKRHDRERLREAIRLNALYSFQEFRRKNHKKNPKLWPLRETPGDLSLSLDRYVNYPLI